MNELIEKMWKKLFTKFTAWNDEGSGTSLSIMDKRSFDKAIQTACQAQRNACWREYIDMIVYRKPGETEDIIKNAEITEADYE
jgi:hypothetical protein